jgi:hypothetical protein
MTAEPAKAKKIMTRIIRNDQEVTKWLKKL